MQQRVKEGNVCVHLKDQQLHVVNVECVEMMVLVEHTHQQDLLFYAQDLQVVQTVACIHVLHKEHVKELHDQGLVLRLQVVKEHVTHQHLRVEVIQEAAV